MSKQSIIEVEATYLDQLEADNFKMYKQVQELTAQVAEMKKDMEVLAYQARLHEAQAQIYAEALDQKRDIITCEDDPWEPDCIERDEGRW